MLGLRQPASGRTSCQSRVGRTLDAAVGVLAVVLLMDGQPGARRGSPRRQLGPERG